MQGIYAFDEKKAGFRTWAYRVAANRITDYYRSKSYKKEKLQQPLQWETEEEKTVRDLAEHMVQKEEIRRIMDIVVSYEREWIRIFQKKCFEEKTFAQIAEEMDLAESTVKTRFYQMLKGFDGRCKDEGKSDADGKEMEERTEDTTASSRISGG